MSSARRRHYHNRAEPGDCIFATTTVIDFAPIFKSARLADIATSEILEHCVQTQVKLHAFVLMHHHLYVVLGLNDQLSGSKWMQHMKTRVALVIGRQMSDRQRCYLSDQIGLNRRSFWKRSFRSIRIESEKVFWQKVRYTHLNPIRAGYCESESDYHWSSKRFWDRGLWIAEGGLEKDAILEEFRTRRAEGSLHNSFLAVEA